VGEVALRHHRARRGALFLRHQVLLDRFQGIHFLLTTFRGI
jgi:hypothetical protein